MPLFEFRCRECGDEFEALVRTDNPAACPSCAGERLERLMSASVARTSGAGTLPLSSACPPSDAPPCGPGCCRLPAR
jgi:putative FmdB family regulatory protein